jgi:ribosomal biogenesis protein LAS1
MSTTAAAVNPSATQQPSIAAKSASKKKKKKRKKSTTDATQIADVNSSKLSIKKRIFLKKSAKQTPWYDIHELMSTGRDLLLALKLFPSPHTSSCHSSAINDIDGSMPSNVPTGLSDNEHSKLQAALRRVALWRGRSDRGGRLPHAIDVTAGLAGVLLMDAERNLGAELAKCDADNSATVTQMHNSHVSLYQLRNSYSTLLLRSVNGLADTYRHQKKSALLSVAHCCSLAGLPLWIVDIRHDASHNDLPSLGVCRIGALESLKFWKGRYWDALDEKVWGDIQASPDTNEIDNNVTNDAPEAGVHTLAMDCLMRYQKAVENEACERRMMSKNKKVKPERKEYRRFSHWQQFSRQDEDAVDQQACVEDDIMVLSSNDDNAKPNKDENSAKKQKVDDNKVNPWWILEDNKPKKKKDKKATQTDENTNEVYPLDDPALATNLSFRSRECAAELIRTAPVDALYSTVLQFLVWSGTVSSNETNTNTGPALLVHLCDSSAPLSQICMEESFEESRISYEPLIVSIVSSYPGFFSALLVHLVDAILCFDAEKKRIRVDSSNNEAFRLNELERNIHCLAMWACYILTREFHMHLDRSVALIGKAEAENEEISCPIDLKKKGRKKWSSEDQQFVQSPLSYKLLQSRAVPLNSVCDRLHTHIGGPFDVPDDQSNNAVMELLVYFQRILGNDRMLHGISKQCHDESIKAPAADKDDTQSHVAPWTLCKSWDACAIGTMPGFPA